MEIYFEDDFDLDINSSCFEYEIGDVISFLNNEQIYYGTIEDIASCYYHNIKCLFYIIKETQNNSRVLIEQDKIIKNFYPEILLLEINFEQITDKNNTSMDSEYLNNFSFIIY